MTGPTRSQIRGNGENRYATHEDFLGIFDEDLNGLYQLAFLLTGDHHKAEGCFVAGIDDCAKENRVFKEWAGAWSKRVIVKNAIRELNPREGHSDSPALQTVISRNLQSRGPIGHFGLGAVLRLADFERFAFVLCVLEHYTAHDCALLLGCAASQLRDARTRAIAELAKVPPTNSCRHEDREPSQRTG